MSPHNTDLTFYATRPPPEHILAESMVQASREHYPQPVSLPFAYEPCFQSRPNFQPMSSHHITAHQDHQTSHCRTRPKPAPRLSFPCRPQVL